MLDRARGWAYTSLTCKDDNQGVVPVRNKRGRIRMAWTAMLAVLGAAMSLASPWVAISSAEAGGADKPRPATFGDCKNVNAGVHNGYDCEEEPEPQVSPS
jgi:hypothetical protein